MFIIFSDTGGVLDFSIKTRQCSSCQMLQSDDKQSEKYKTWYEKHAPDCTINFGGSSGTMESAGVEMWLRSIKKNNLRYKTFGDGLQEYKKRGGKSWLMVEVLVAPIELLRVSWIISNIIMARQYVLACQRNENCYTSNLPSHDKE